MLKDITPGYVKEAIANYCVTLMVVAVTDRGTKLYKVIAVCPDGSDSMVAEDVTIYFKGSGVRRKHLGIVLRYKGSNYDLRLHVAESLKVDRRKVVVC